MKRIAVIAVFAVLGLLSTCAAAVLTSGVNLAATLGIQPGANSCGELGKCGGGWWIGIPLALLLFGPTLLHAVAGFQLGKHPFNLRKAAIFFAVLVALTFALWLLLPLLMTAIDAALN